MFIGDFQIPFDSQFQLSSAPMGATAKLFLGQSGKPALNLVDPRGPGRSKMQMIARPLCQPTMDHGRFMGPVIVQNQMDVQIRRNGIINSIQEFAKFNRSMPTMTFADHLTRLHIERSKERRRSIAGIIVSAPLFESVRDYGPEYKPARTRPSATSDNGYGYWYLCKESNAYYPYVRQCPGGWEKVPVLPPSSGPDDDR